MHLGQVLHGRARGMLHPLQCVQCRIAPWGKPGKGLGAMGYPRGLERWGNSSGAKFPAPQTAGLCLEGSILFFHPKEGGDVQTSPADGCGFANS